jgi:hypothetical protein
MKKMGMIILVSTLALGLGAQEITEKKDLTIFDISYFKSDLDLGVVNSVDTEISQVFINLGRFNVIGMEFRLDAANVTDFADQVKALKESTTQLPDEVRFGDAYFTLEDFNRLVGSFIIVIPQITNYSNEYSDGRYKAFIETSFTFLNAETMEAFAAFKIDTEGSDEDSPTIAANNAINLVPAQLSFEIRSIPEFQLKTAVLDVDGRDVIIQMGQDFGLQPGTNSPLTNPLLPASAVPCRTRLARSSSSRWVRISLRPTFFMVRPLWAAALKSIQDTELTSCLWLDTGYRYAVDDNEVASHLSFALTAIQSRGAFDARGFASLEIPTMTALVFFLPLTVTAGLQQDYHMDRLMVSWYMGGSLGAAIPWLFDPAEDADELADQILSYTTHIGARGGLKASMLFGKDWRVGGFAQVSAMLALPRTSFVKDVAQAFGVPREFLTFFQTYAAAEVGLEVVYKY